VKKKLAALDLRIQFALVLFGLLIFGYAGHTLVVSPLGAQATKVQSQIDSQQTQIFQRRTELRKARVAPTIESADLFKLSRAMPDREDMPGIILALGEVARAAGIKFNLIEPVVGASITVTGAYTPVRIHLLFNGDFYGLSDFLYRIRSLVAVRNGTLQADGRLFNVDSVSFNVSADKFPQIQAELFVDTYVYGTAPTPAPTTPSTTTPSTTTPASSDSSLPTGATATGATG
jgi:Tfp pilus assembly protein PilO